MSRQSLRSSSITSTRGRVPSVLVSGETFCFTANQHVTRNPHKHPHFYTSLTIFRASRHLPNKALSIVDGTQGRKNLAPSLWCQGNGTTPLWLFPEGRLKNYELCEALLEN